MTLLFQGHAHAVLDREDGSFQTYNFREWHDISQQEPGPECVRTVTFRIRIPRVILLLVYDHMPKKEVKFTRHNIFERDKNTCQYCGQTCDRKDLNLDHVVPRSRGGKSEWENVVVACRGCNQKKGNRTPREAQMTLLREPHRPRYVALALLGEPTHREVWSKYLF